MKQKRFENSSFPPLSKEKWVEQINEQLSRHKKSFNDLLLNVEDGITLEPFYHVDEIQNRTKSISWRDGQYWQAGLSLGDESSLEDLKLCSRLDPDYVLVPTSHKLLFELFSSDDNPPSQKIPFQLFWENKPDPSRFDKIISLIRGRDRVIFRAPSVGSSSSFYYLKDLPVKNRIFWIRQLDWQTSKTLQLIEILQKMILLLENLSSRQIRKGKILITIGIGYNYLLEIAKIRALKLLLKNLWKAYEIPFSTLPELEVWITLDPQQSDPNQQLISSTSQAMSAVIAGVDKMVIRPGKYGNNNLVHPNYRDIFFHIHHILSLESFFNRIIDPAAGSYFIENATSKFATKAWEEIQVKRAGKLSQGNH